MDGLVKCPFHSNDDEIIIVSALLTRKRKIDPDFSVQSVNEIHIIMFEAFDLPGFPATGVYDRSRYFFSAVTLNATKKAECIMQPLPRVKSLRIANQHSTSDFRNHVAENRLSGVGFQLVPSHVSAFILEIMLQHGCQGLSSHRSNCNARNHVAENVISEVEAVQLPS